MLTQQAELALWQQEQKQLQQLQQRWLLGDGGAELQLPTSWQSYFPAAQTSDDKALQALAFCSQYPLFNKVQQPDGLKALPAVPLLSLPTLATALRPAFRTILADIRQQPQALHALLSLLAHRGFVPHPLDWLPKTSDLLLPEILGPWWFFAAGYATTPQLTTENWSSTAPLVRIVLLAKLRQTAPEQARQLLSDCAPQCPAEQRAAFLQLLQINLSEADLPTLHHFANDKSDKVRTVCRNFLLQLGHAVTPSAMVDELKDWLQKQRSGWLLRDKKIVTPEVKNRVQMNNLCQALSKVALPELAAALELSLDELLLQWSFTDNQGTDPTSEFLTPNQALLQNAAQTLPQPQLKLLLNKFVKELLPDQLLDRVQLEIIATLMKRLPEAEQTELMQQLIASCAAENPIANLAALHSEHWHWLAKEHFVKLPLQQQLNSALAQLNKTTKPGQGISQLLLWLGLLVPQTTAAAIYQQAIKAGISATDPILETLSFNLSLQKGNHDE